MKLLWIKFVTACRLGIFNIITVLWYRIVLKRKKIGSVVREISNCDAFMALNFNVSQKNLSFRKYWSISQMAFGRKIKEIDKTFIPDWFMNSLTNKREVNQEVEWGNLSDFNLSSGDIKGVWEASRWDWIITHAQNYILGDAQSLLRLNSWIDDWLINNPPYKGLNWKCGQEASIRVIHLALAIYIINAEIKGLSPKIEEILKIHLTRIHLTLSYAIAQNNNHGTSEAAALYIGGSLLNQMGIEEGKSWEEIGRKWLNNRARKLIANDGGFSQYSINYHRLMLETYSFAEVWRRWLKLPEFNKHTYFKLRQATKWLYMFVDPSTGHVPNLGSNDGARLLCLTDSDYRDYRESVDLASLIFMRKKAYSLGGTTHEFLNWMRIFPDTEHYKMLPPRSSAIFDDTGYAILINQSVWLAFYYPRFKFRPSQADLLHVDLWINGENWLRDAGSYSYNTQKKWLDYFPNNIAHNTVQFDEHFQMPKISRFLFGFWPKTINRTFAQNEVSASFRDYRKCFHSRTLRLNKHTLEVMDVINNFDKKAVLRWRLRPSHWDIDEKRYAIKSSEGVSLSISSNVPIGRFEIVHGYESQYYGSKEEIPVLEVEVNSSGYIKTQISWGG